MNSAKKMQRLLDVSVSTLFGLKRHFQSFLFKVTNSSTVEYARANLTVTGHVSFTAQHLIHSLTRKVLSHISKPPFSLPIVMTDESGLNQHRSLRLHSQARLHRFQLWVQKKTRNKKSSNKKSQFASWSHKKKLYKSSYKIICMILP